MGTPISFNSGTTASYTAGIFKKATVGLNLKTGLVAGNNWWNGVDVSATQYLIYSDIYSQGQSTFAGSRPTAWSTPDLSDASLILLINTLPDRVGLPGFTTVSQAVNWLNQTGKYFLIKTGYENIVTSNLKVNMDAGWYNSYAVKSVCATASEGGTVNITAPAGYKFVKVVFASYGTPTGSCGSFVIDTSCHSRTSKSVVEGYLLNQSGTISIPASNAVFGDPCPGIEKRLYVQALVAPATWSDISGNFYSATLYNGPGFSGNDNGVLVFDGTDDYGSFGQSLVGAGNTAYTVIVWCKRNRNNVGYEELIAQWTNAGSGNSFYFGFDGSNVRFTDNWYSVPIPGAGNVGEWMCLVGVNTGSNAYIYLNGVLMATKGSALTYTATGNMVIGRQGELPGEYFSGSIGLIQIYDTALTSSQILQNFNAQAYRFGLNNNLNISGTVNYWDAGNLISYPGTGTTVRDLSGNGNTSTLVNGSFSSSLGGAFIINASNQAIVTPGASGLNEWSIGFFVRRDGNPTGYGRLAGTYPSYDCGEIALLNNTGEIGVVPPNGPNWINTGVILSTNEVAHIMVYFSRNSTQSNNLKLWKNGSLVYTNSITSADKGGITGYFIGTRSDYNGEYTPATYWSTTLYDRQLSTNEVLQNSYGANIVTSDLKLLLDAANPVSYPTTGTVWKDLSTNSINGTLTNGPTFSTDYGGYFNFDGTDDYVQISSILNSYPFTVSFWASSDVSWIPSTDMMQELLNMNIGGQRVSLGTTRYNAGNWVAGPCLFYGGTSHWSISAADAGMGTGFVNVVWVVHGSNNTNHQIYVNGVSQQMYNNGGNHGGTPGWAIASNGYGDEYWDGKISNVTVYNKTLTPIEIQQNFNAYKSRYGL